MNTRVQLSNCLFEHEIFYRIFAYNITEMLKTKTIGNRENGNISANIEFSNVTHKIFIIRQRVKVEISTYLSTYTYFSTTK